MEDDTGVPTDPADVDPRLQAMGDLFEGRYVIRAPLPWGGLAVCYDAEELGRPVVVAVLPIDCEGSLATTQAFEMWALMVEDMDHALHLSVTDSGIQHGMAYLELEAFDGETLWDRLERSDIPPGQALKLVVDVAKAVAAGHAQNLLHWDLTPANVLVRDRPDGSFETRVMGFGVAPLLHMVADSDKTGPTGRGSGRHASRFAAPERRDGRAGGLRADQYSLGGLVELLMTGSPPGPARAPARSLHVRGLDKVVARAMTEDPEARFDDVATLAQALEALEERLSKPPGPGAGNLAEALEPESPKPAEPLKPAGDQAPAVSAAVPETSGSGLGRWLAIGGVLAALVVGAVLATSLDESGRRTVAEPAVAEPAAAERTVAEPAVAEPAPAIVAGTSSGPLAGALPEPLAGALARIDGGARFTQAELQPLYGYLTAHPMDARGHMVMARAFMNLGWGAAAADAYARAGRVGEGLSADPLMLEHVLELIADREEMLDKLWQTVRATHGWSAVPAVEAAMAAADDNVERARLRRLRRRLDRLRPTE